MVTFRESLVPAGVNLPLPGYPEWSAKSNFPRPEGWDRLKTGAVQAGWVRGALAAATAAGSRKVVKACSTFSRSTWVS